MINNKEVNFVKSRNGVVAIVFDRDKNVFQIYSELKTYKPTPIPYDQIFSYRGYNLREWNIRAIGNNTLMYVKLTNVKRNLVITFSHKEMLERAYDSNTKIPLYVKQALAYITNKLIDLQKEPIELTLVAKHRLIDSVLTLAVPCPKAKTYVSLDRCRFCEHNIAILDRKIPKVLCRLK